MNEKVKDRMETVRELIEAVREAPDHILEIDTPYGPAEIRLKALGETNQPLKRSKAQIEVVKQRIAALVTKNEQLLREEGLTVKDVLKTLPQVRVEYNKEKYGIDQDTTD